MSPTPTSTFSSLLSGAAGGTARIEPGDVSSISDALRVGPDAFDVGMLSIPGYELLEEIGRGGMGVVFKARQQALGRLVALKMILALGQPSAADRMRFLVEAESLARVKHPNIVEVHEAGTHQGAPFVVMEYVEGGSLAAHLQGRPQPPRAAAALAETLARAIHAAHLQGIVHRDLKPANILLAKPSGEVERLRGGEEGLPHPLTPSPPHILFPKITDFGLAKRMDRDETLTAAGVILGTPCYMAPEQAVAKGHDVGPAADQYALGVILYELLTGRRPFDDSSSFTVLQQVVHDEPPLPRRLAPGVPRDLEVIVLKCLAKEPARRYPSAEALADDLRRFLEDRPIQARPVGTAERLLKWLRRNPALGAMTALLLLLAVGGFLALAGLWRQAEGEKTKAEQQKQKAVKEKETAEAATKRAERAEAEAKALNEFLVEKLTAAARPTGEGLGRDVSLQQALAEAAKAIDTTFKDQPLVAASVHEKLSLMYRSLGRPKEARTQGEAAYQSRLKLLGPDDPATLNGQGNYAECLRAMGELEKAEPLLRDTLARQRKVFGAEHIDTLATLQALGVTLQDLDRLDEAEPLLKEAHALILKTVGPRHEHALQSGTSLSQHYLRRGKLAEAVPLLRKLLAQAEDYLGVDATLTQQIRMNLAAVDREQGKLDQAEKTLREILASYTRVLGPDHPSTVTAQSNLAVLLSSMKRLAEAEKLGRDVVAKRTKTLGPKHVDTLLAVNNLARFRFEQGDATEAATLYRQAHEGLLATVGPSHLRTLIAHLNYTEALVAAGRPAEAEALARAYLKTEATLKRPEGFEVWFVRNLLGASLMDQGRLAEAEPLLVESFQKLAAEPRLRKTRRLADAGNRVVLLFEKTGDAAQAAAWRKKADEANARTP